MLDYPCARAPDGYESLPAQVLQGVKAIAASNGSSFVVLSDGTVWTWGSVMRQNSTVPIQVAGLTGVVAIGQSLAGKADGTVWQWGANTNDMSAIDTIPVLKSGLSGVVAVAGSGYSGLALRTDGTVWQWGWYLQVGEGQAPGTPASGQWAHRRGDDRVLVRIRTPTWPLGPMGLSGTGDGDGIIPSALRGWCPTRRRRSADSPASWP